MGIKFNPLPKEFDLVNPENFSYNVVPLGKTVKIPTNQQMIVYEDITINGVLTIEGDLVIFDLEIPSRIVESSTTESINVELYEVIRQTASGITLSLSGMIEGSKITIVNASTGTNTLNFTIQGAATPSIYTRESYSIVYNGTDWDVV